MGMPTLQDGTPLFPSSVLGNGLGLPITASSGNVANASAVATISATALQTAYLTGFEVTASGATTGLPVNVTVVGLIGGTATYTFVFPAGALVAALPLTISLPSPVPASNKGVNIVVTLPAGGAGNTNAAVVAHGFVV